MFIFYGSQKRENSFLATKKEKILFWQPKKENLLFLVTKKGKSAFLVPKKGKSAFFLDSKNCFSKFAQESTVVVNSSTSIPFLSPQNAACSAGHFYAVCLLLLMGLTWFFNGEPIWVFGWTKYEVWVNPKTQIGEPLKNQVKPIKSNKQTS